MFYIVFYFVFLLFESNLVVFIIEQFFSSRILKSGLAAKAKESIEKKLPKLVTKEASPIEKKNDCIEEKSQNKDEKKIGPPVDEPSQDIKPPKLVEGKRVSPLMSMFMSRLVTPNVAKSPSLSGKSPKKQLQSVDSDSSIDKPVMSPLDRKALASPQVKQRFHRKSRDSSSSSGSSDDVKIKRSKRNSSSNSSSSRR